MLVMSHVLAMAELILKFVRESSSQQRKAEVDLHKCAACQDLRESELHGGWMNFSTQLA